MTGGNPSVSVDTQKMCDGSFASTHGGTSQRSYSPTNYLHQFLHTAAPFGSLLSARSFRLAPFGSLLSARSFRLALFGSLFSARPSRLAFPGLALWRLASPRGLDRDAAVRQPSEPTSVTV